MTFSPTGSTLIAILQGRVNLRYFEGEWCLQRESTVDETVDRFTEMGLACVCNEGDFIQQQVALRQAVICSKAGGDLERTVTAGERETGLCDVNLISTQII